MCLISHSHSAAVSLALTCSNVLLVQPSGCFLECKLEYKFMLQSIAATKFAADACLAFIQHFASCMSIRQTTHNLHNNDSVLCRLLLYPDMMYGYYPERLPPTQGEADRRRGVRIEMGGMMRCALVSHRSRECCLRTVSSANCVECCLRQV